MEIETETKEIESLIDGAKATVGGACIDPRPRPMAVLDKICEPLRHVPADIAPRLYKDAKIQMLAERIRDLIERGDYAAIDLALNEGRANVANVLAFERREGSLKPPSTADEIKNHANAFFENRWNGNETGGWQKMPTVQEKIQAGRHIRKVTLRSVELDDGSIVSRADVHRYVLSQRPKFGDTISDDKYLTKFFAPERVLIAIENARAIQEQEQIRKRTTYQSGPTSLISTPIPVEQR